MGAGEMTAESVRGASSLVAAARHVGALSIVPPKKAEELRWYGSDLVRIDVARENRKLLGNTERVWNAFWRQLAAFVTQVKCGR